MSKKKYWEVIGLEPVANRPGHNRKLVVHVKASSPEIAMAKARKELIGENEIVSCGWEDLRLQPTAVNEG